MVNNPDDMGIYNPHIDEWVRIVHDAGGLCFYDHANFNGVMGQDPRARPRLRRVHVHAPQDLRRAEGRRRAGGRRVRLHRGARAGSCRRPSSCATATASGSTTTGPRASARCASSGATCQQVVKAYALVAGDGRRGDQGGGRPLGAREQLHGQADPRDPAASRARNAQLDVPRMEMTRFSLGELQRETGIGVFDVANRLADYGIDAPWRVARAVDRPRADHARGRRDVVEGGHRLVDRRARPGLPRGPRGSRARPDGAAQPGRAQARRRPARRPRRTGRRPGVPGGGSTRAGRRSTGDDRPGAPCSSRAPRRGSAPRSSAALGRAGAHVAAHYGSDRAGARDGDGGDPGRPEAAARRRPVRAGARRRGSGRRRRRGGRRRARNNAAVMEQVPFDAPLEDVARGLGARLPDQRRSPPPT